MTLSTRGTLQWAEGRLLPTEQLGAGGVATVRGYDEGMAYGDRGLLINTELRLPVWSPSERAGSLQLLAFLDYATISQKHPEDGEDPHANLPASVGACVTNGNETSPCVSTTAGNSSATLASMVNPAWMVPNRAAISA